MMVDPVLQKAGSGPQNELNLHAQSEATAQGAGHRP
jgi:hypothetical protein